MLNDLRRRSIAIASVLALATMVVALSSTAGVAAAAPVQTDGCAASGSDYPPEGETVASTSNLQITSASFPPGGTGSLGLAGATPGAEYDGTVTPGPISLPATVAQDDGTLNFTGFAVPADFDVDATLTVELCHDGSMVLSTSICLDANGTLESVGACDDDIVPATGENPGGESTGSIGSTGSTGSTGSGDTGAAGGALAFTGLDHLSTLLRLGGVLLAAGIAALYWQRRRLAGA